ncbi:MAG: nucleotide exchange factor GrpE [Peptococcaceae bacterium]|nr:nucleotide exchange factor GrpE [Peptococcaceae bacterium]
MLEEEKQTPPALQDNRFAGEAVSEDKPGKPKTEDEKLDVDKDKDTDTDKQETVPDEENAKSRDGDRQEALSEVERLKEELAREQARAEEYYQRMIRLQADFENFRRRTRQEKEQWFRQAVEELLGELLPVLDNFERALQVPGNDLNNFVSGVDMIKRQLWDILDKQGLQRMQCENEEFDPNKHEAVSYEETDSPGEDQKIVAELRPGYYFRDKVLRPAMVKVAKFVGEGGRKDG